MPALTRWAEEVSGGLHGVGLSCVRPVRMAACDVRRDGHRHEQRYSRGLQMAHLSKRRARAGTRIVARRPNIRQELDFDPEVLRWRVEERHPNLSANGDGH